MPDEKKSSHIDAIEPHPHGGLVVTFNNGTRYHYPDAPQHLANTCMSAPSIGQAFHHHIRQVFKGHKL